MFKLLKMLLFISLGFLIGSSSWGLKMRDTYSKYFAKHPVAEGFYPNPYGLERQVIVNSQGKLEVHLWDRDSGWSRKIGPQGISQGTQETLKKTPKADKPGKLKDKERAPGFVDKPLDLTLEVDMNEDGKLETFLVNPHTNERLAIKQVGEKTQVGSYEEQFSSVYEETKGKISSWKNIFSDLFGSVWAKLFAPEKKAEPEKEKSK